MQIVRVFFLFVLLAATPAAFSQSVNQYVNLFMGTADHGHVYPGATVPFGTVQLSPDNGTQGWDWCSGYNYADSIITGFSHTHLSGTGIGDLYDILVMPAIRKMPLEVNMADPLKKPYIAGFSHRNEEASPGYYRVRMDNGIQAELSATTYSGLHRYTFPKGQTASLVLDLAHAMNWDAAQATEIRVVNERLITGYRFSKGWAKDQRVYFAMVLSQPIQSYSMVDSHWEVATDSPKGSGSRAQFFFGTLPGEVLEVEVGISSASPEGALAGISKKTFAQARAESASDWEKELGKIKVEGDDALKTTFYTSLYRTALAPVQFSDAQGNYRGADGKVHHSQGYRRYDIFSLWDTFRAANPLYTLTQPDKINDFVRSLLDHYQQYGLLPVWSLLGNETNTMTGYHAVPVVVDAYLKGFREYDVAMAFEALLKSGAQDIRGSNHYRAFGYIPFDKDGESVTKTLEYAFDDWCIAQMAKAMGKEKEAAEYQKRAQYYRNMFDPQTGFMRAKLSNGSWKTPFNPKYSDHNFEVAEYTEGNAWQHSWFVPHDPRGLIQLHGGDAPFIKKLDQLFDESSEILGEFKSNDISGLIGQYAHGNEPSHHIAYLYNYAGAPWKTQAIVRQIMQTQYNNTPSGLCGNEDCGQMSAWYVFSAAGLYPVNPASGVYALGSPLFTKVTLPGKDGKSFTISAPNNSAQNKYIQKASLNGQPLGRSYLTHAEILAGGQLVLEMGSRPNTRLWTGKNARP